MVGWINPRGETVRGTHWPVKVAGVFGARVAENHLGQRSKVTASTGRTYGCKRSDQTLKKLLWHGGHPHMGPGVRRDDEGELAYPELTFSVIPPSTTSSMPVTYFDSSEARNSAALATSQASPMCPIGTCASRARHIASTSPAA